MKELHPTDSAESARSGVSASSETWTDKALSEVFSPSSQVLRTAVSVGLGVAFSRYTPATKLFETTLKVGGVAAVAAVGLDLAGSEHKSPGAIFGDAALMAGSALIGANLGYRAFGKPVALALEGFNPIAKWMHGHPLSTYALAFKDSPLRVKPTGDFPFPQNLFQRFPMGKDSIALRLANPPALTGELSYRGETLANTGAFLKIGKRDYPESTQFGEFVLDQGRRNGVPFRISLAAAEVGVPRDIIHNDMMPLMQQHGYRGKSDDMRPDNFGWYQTASGAKMPFLLDPFAASKKI